MTTYFTSIDEISGELDTTLTHQIGSWPMVAALRIGDYLIREYRSDRNHLGIEVSGPDHDTTRNTAQALFDLYWQ